MSSRTYGVIITVFILILLAIGGYIYYIENIVPSSTTVQQAQQTNFVDTLNKGDLDGAITSAQNLVNSNQKNITDLLDLSLAYLNKGSIDMMEDQYADKAIAVINQVLALNPDNEDASEAYRNLGYAYEIKQDYADAIPAYTKAISLDPQNSLALANRGHAYSLMGSSTEAIADYKASFAISFLNDYNLMNMSRYYYSQGDASSTIAYATLALKVAVNNREIATLQDLIGMGNVKIDDFDSAQAAFSASLAADPTYDVTYVDRGYMNFDKLTNASGALTAGEAQEINVDLDRALTINPKDTSAYVIKAMIADSMGDSATEVADAKQVLNMVDNDIDLSQTDKDDYRTQAQQIIASNGKD